MPSEGLPAARPRPADNIDHDAVAATRLVRVVADLVNPEIAKLSPPAVGKFWNRLWRLAAKHAPEATEANARLAAWGEMFGDTSAAKAIAIIERLRKACESQSPEEPAAGTGDSGWESAIQQCNCMVAKAGAVPDRGRDFADSVAEKSLSIGRTIQQSRRVSAEQQRSLDNMEGGLDRWLRDAADNFCRDDFECTIEEACGSPKQKPKLAGAASGWGAPLDQVDLGFVDPPVSDWPPPADEVPW